MQLMMKFKTIRLLAVVLASAAVVLPPIYFVILQAEFVPHPQKVINYFYDRRTFIGIDRLVTNDNEGVRENWRTIRQRGLGYDPDTHIDDSKLPPGIDQSVEETLHSFPPDIITQSEIGTNQEMIKEDLLSESLVTLGPVDKDAKTEKMATPDEPDHPHSTQRNHMQTVTPGTEQMQQLQSRSAQPPRLTSMTKGPSVSRVKLSPKQPHPLPPSTPHANMTTSYPPTIVATSATPPLSHPKLLATATTPLSNSILHTDVTRSLSHRKLPIITSPLSHSKTIPPSPAREARTTTTSLRPTSNLPSKPLTEARIKMARPPGKHPQIVRTQPSEKERPVHEATRHPMPLPAPPPRQGAVRVSLRKTREAIAKSRLKSKQVISWKVPPKLAQKARAHRKVHVYRRLPIIVNCTDSMCKQLTVSREKYYYNSCLKLAEEHYSVHPCECRLMDGKKRGRYALVSLPGSGNTWVRGLLEKATGVCTGSMWCDPSLRAKHFCMEGVRSTSVLIVKNHDSHLRWVGGSFLPGEAVHNKPDFVGAILIHRDPFSATIAEWNRDAAIILKNATANKTEASITSESTSNNDKHQHRVVRAAHHSTADDKQNGNVTKFRDVITAETRESVKKLLLDQKIVPVTDKSKNQHLLYFGKEMFGNNAGWNETVYLQAEKWKRMIEHFIINNRVQPVLVVRYEDLKADPVLQVKRILKFLKYQYDEEDVEQRLTEGFSAYHRNHTDSFEHYTLEQKTYMNSVIMSVMKRLDQQRITDFIPLEHYLHP